MSKKNYNVFVNIECKCEAKKKLEMLIRENPGGEFKITTTGKGDDILYHVVHVVEDK